MATDAQASQAGDLGPDAAKATNEPRSPKASSLRACLQRRVWCLFGLPFDALSLDDAVAQVRLAVRNRTPCFISTPNVNFVVAAQRDRAFRDSVLHSDLSLPDGMPIVWLARWLGLPVHGRVAGADLFDRLRTTPGPVLKVYFFGGLPGVAARASAALNAEASSVRCVGFASPGFGSLDDMSRDALIDHINASGADFLVVSLGAVKGQAWLVRNRHRLNVPVVSHLGAVINFVAGGVHRSPTSLRRSGLEWVWRIKEEPMLWRRYWHDAIGLASLILRQLLPARWHAEAVPGVRPSTSALEATVSRRPDAAPVLQLAGACTATHLPALRQHLDDLADAGGPMQVDLTDVTEIDSETVALLLLLDARQATPPLIVRGRPLRPRVAKTLRCFGAAALAG